MEDKLRAIVTRIDSSKLDGSDKDALYKILSAGLRAIYLPVLLKHMPKDELKDLAANPSKVTVDAYMKLIDDTFVDGTAFTEMQTKMEALLVNVDAELSKAGI